MLPKRYAVRSKKQLSIDSVISEVRGKTDETVEHRTHKPI